MGDRKNAPAFRPPHPGEYLREDILPALNMSVTDLAKHLGVSRNSASRIVHEKASISLDMAVRLGQAFQNGARFWLALQMQHDLWETERRSEIHVAPIEHNNHCAA